MTDWKTVTLRVSPETKEQWEEYAENHPEVGNLSHLIRLSVHREISENETAGSQRETDTQQLGEVLEGVNQIKTALQDVQYRLDALERESRFTEGIDIQKAVFSALPTPPKGKTVDVSGLDETDSQEMVIDSLQPHQWAATAADIADNLGIDDKTVVRNALLQLTEVTGQVRSVSGGKEGKTWWWKRE